MWRLKKFEIIEVWNNCLACHRGYRSWEHLCVTKIKHGLTIRFLGMNFLLPCYFEKTWLLWLVCLKYYYFLYQYELLSWIFRIWIFMPQLIRFTLKLCQISLKHQKFSFYHLPTRGRAGIKLGDAWYVSNVSIIFYCSMLYYLLFWTILGFIFHFYIIFGTDLLTGGPAQNCSFLPILEFHRKRISNGVQMEWNLRERDFRNEHDPGDLDPTSSN